MYNISTKHLLFLLLLMILSIIFTALINGIFLKFSKTLGTRDNTVIRWATETKPSVGGFGFYIMFLCSIIFFTIFVDPESIFKNIKFVGIVIAISLGFIMGLADDAYNTKPLLKLGVQILCAIILYLTGTQVQTFNVEYLNFGLTILWVVGIMNSINLLDNMDGITGSISVIITSFLILTIILFHNTLSIDLIILVSILGALIGFLIYNWHPSKLFMGDTGSQFLGVYLAAFGITYIWNQEDVMGNSIVSKQILNVALVFIIPLIDTTTVFINRIIRGQSPFIGGRDHTTHNLSYLGLSDKNVAIIMVAITLLSSILAIIVNNMKEWTSLKSIPFFAFWVIVFVTLFTITRRHEYKFKK